MKLFHIHWYTEIGTTSKHGPKWTGWSTIWRCRCGHEVLKEL